MNNVCYDYLKDIIIPIVAAVIGGGLTLLGVIYTIRNENRKAKEADRERIRPFFVVEDKKRTKINPKEAVSIWIDDDSQRDKLDNSTVFYWDSCVITNVSENVCFIDYIRMDGTEYKADRVPIKSGDSFEIKGFPLSYYVRERSISEISIGVQDRLQNQYEYPLRFDLVDYNTEMHNSGKLKVNKVIMINEIDCNNYKLNGKPKDT